jgi:hypothetical protein
MSDSIGILDLIALAAWIYIWVGVLRVTVFLVGLATDRRKK